MRRHNLAGAGWQALMHTTSRFRRALVAAALVSTLPGCVTDPSVAASRKPLTPRRDLRIQRLRLERRMLERRSRLLAVDEGAATLVDGHRIYEVRLRAASGLVVDLLVKRPAVDTAGLTRPVALLLGGRETGREAAKLIPDTRGTVVAALSYPYAGPHRVRGLGALRHVPAMRQAVFDTPPAVMLAADYLLAQPGVDSAALDGVGVSLGVPFMTIAAAMDRRIGRVWAIHGSAGAYEPIEHNLRRQIGNPIMRGMVAWFASRAVLGDELAPEHWVGRIAPRPFVMINAADDERMPRRLVERLFASAREPKSETWLPGGHVRPEPAVARRLVDLVLDRLAVDPRARHGGS